MTDETELRAALEDANVKYWEYRNAKDFHDGQKSLADAFDVKDSPDVEGFRKVMDAKYNAFTEANRRVMDLKLETKEA